MRIFVAGATGVLGRELLPLLAGHAVVGMTRTRPRLVRELGADPVVVDIYDRDRLVEALAAARPEVVVHLVTDLAGRDFRANNRVRREGTPNLVEAAVAAGARRLVVEGVAFEVSAEAAAAITAMEEAVAASGLEVAFVRLGRLWGPGTWAAAPEPGGGYVHIREAAESIRAAILAP